MRQLSRQKMAAKESGKLTIVNLQMKKSDKQIRKLEK